MKQVAESGVIAAKQAEMQTEAPKKALTLGDLVNGRKGELAKVLPSVLPPDQFCRLALKRAEHDEALKGMYARVVLWLADELRAAGLKAERKRGGISSAVFQRQEAGI